jgi:V/A-type H+-transporting ATPase subunit E
MSEDLQSLLEKINREGVEKAQAAADEIIAKAKAQAAALVKEAEAVALKAKADAEIAANDYAARAAETIRQAARDTVISVEGAITDKLVALLAKDVKAALAEPKAVAALAADVVKEFAAKGEVKVAAAEAVAATLKAQLASEKNLKVETDPTLGTGFTVKLDGGRVEHSFTGAVVADELAKRLRSDLAKLVK